jgi:hypothetical protein
MKRSMLFVCQIPWDMPVAADCPRHLRAERETNESHANWAATIGGVAVIRG